MKPRTVLVLAVLVVALGAFIWFVDRDLPSSDERAELAGRLLAVESDEVTGLVSEWQGRSVRLERRGEEAGAAASGWWLVEPMTARADSTEVDLLVDALTSLEKKRTLEDAELQAVGLDSPRGTVTISAGDRQWTLGVGTDVPTSSDVLVSLAEGDGPVGTYVTTAGFVDQLGREPGAWRARDVFPAVQGAVERLTLQAPGAAAPVVLERRGGRFWIDQPVTDLADADRVDDLLAGLSGLRVTEFVDDVSGDGTEGVAEGAAEGAEGADLGLSPPRLTIEAALEEATPEEDGTGPEPFRLELGAPVDESDSTTVYARSGGQTFTSATDLVALGAVTVDAWRSPAWTGLRSFEIEGVEVEAPEGSFTLTRDAVDWQRDGETLPYGVVDDLLSALTEARGEVVTGGEAAGEASPESVTLRLARRDGDPVTLTVQGKPPAGGETGGEGDVARLARSSERTVAVRLPGDTVSKVLDALDAARHAEPEAAELKTTEPEGAELKTTEPEGAELETTEPEAPELKTTEPKAPELETTEPEAPEPATAEGAAEGGSADSASE